MEEVKYLLSLHCYSVSRTIKYVQKMKCAVGILSLSERDHMEKNLCLSFLTWNKLFFPLTLEYTYLCKALSISRHNFDIVCMMFAKSRHIILQFFVAYSKFFGFFLLKLDIAENLVLIYFWYFNFLLHQPPLGLCKLYNLHTELFSSSN